MSFVNFLSLSILKSAFGKIPTVKRQRGVTFFEMNAKPFLVTICEALKKHSLEAILVGNAAAALQGAPVTTIDFDFMFRDTPANRTKLKKIAVSLDAMILRPYYPVSRLYRVVNDSLGLQVDFMPHLHGITSFASLRSRANEIQIDSVKVLTADLGDIIKSKRAAGRKSDKAVLPVLTKTYEVIKKKKGSKGS